MDDGFELRAIPSVTLHAGGASSGVVDIYSDKCVVIDPRFALLKRFLDVVVAATLIVLFSPVLLALAVVVNQSSPGTVLFRQPRIGRGGKSFLCYKFRTMVVNADEELTRILEGDQALRSEWERSHKLRKDPRITKIGGFLRKSSLDELPQLINVLRGEMSLVGPRPALKAQLTLYGRSSKWYYAVRPGMTGLWQVTARGDKDFRRRIALDCYYARHVSLVMDLVILIKTVKVVLTGRGAY